MKDAGRQTLIRLAGENIDTEGVQRLAGAMLSSDVQWCFFRADGQGYLRLQAADADGLDHAALMQCVAEQWPGIALDVAVLERMRSVAGASAGQAPQWQYVVETDVAPEMEAEFNRWYDQEHMPGLAAVSGVVRAQRWLAGGQTPRYHAIYDLQYAQAFGSPEWLAVRATAWSDQVRPFFRNTRRILFRRVALG